jgi:DNA repair exonuclease SbcCD ATPase subunit
MEEKDSVEVGSQPADKVEVKDEVQESSPEKDGKAESSTEQPWHKDPRFKQDLGLLKAAKSLMEKNGLESIEDLVDLAESGSKIKGKQVDLDRLDEIQKKAEKLDKYEAYWKDQEEKKRRETEDPDETIARLEDKLKRKEAAEKHKEESQRQQEAAKQALKNYDREIQSIVKEMEMPKEQQAFAMEFMGVNNPFNEIDITDRKAINRMVAEQKKKLDAFKQSVIQDYIKGKETIPKVGSTTAAPMGEKSKVYLKDARKALHEAMNRVTGG